MPDQTPPRFTVVPPAFQSAHNLALGWTVKDNAPDAAPWSACSGDERTCKRYAAAMNRRDREGSL
jgi:hypothetical protein